MYTSTRLMSFGALGAVILASCTQPPICDAALPSERVAAAGQLLDCLNSLDPTPASGLPTSGTATYAGYMVGDMTPSVGASDTLIGDASLVANFDAGVNTVSGTISNIASTAQGDLVGTLTMTSGPILTNQNQIQFTAAVDGTLTGYGIENITFATAGNGGFLGSNLQGIIVSTSGSATLSGGYVGTANLALLGYK